MKDKVYSANMFVKVTFFVETFPAGGTVNINAGGTVNINAGGTVNINTAFKNQFLVKQTRGIQ